MCNVSLQKPVLLPELDYIMKCVIKSLHTYNTTCKLYTMYKDAIIQVDAVLQHVTGKL